MQPGVEPSFYLFQVTISASIASGLSLWYNYLMIMKIVRKKDLHDSTLDKSDIEFWLSKTPVERLNAVEFLRKQLYAEYPERLQRVYKITELK